MNLRENIVEKRKKKQEDKKLKKIGRLLVKKYQEGIQPKCYMDRETRSINGNTEGD